MKSYMDRTKEIYGVTLVGSVVNVALLLFKFIAGIVGHSAAMVADAVHRRALALSCLPCD